MASAAMSPGRQTLRRMFGNTSVLIGGGLVLFIGLMAIFAPVLDTMDPSQVSTSTRLKPPGFEGEMRIYTDEGRVKIPVYYRMGSDNLGRDVYSRVIYGARISLVVGISVATISIVLGMFIGLIAG